jgi:hypothetical protein
MVSEKKMSAIHCCIVSFVTMFRHSACPMQTCKAIVENKFVTLLYLLDLRLQHYHFACLVRTGERERIRWKREVRERGRRTRKVEAGERSRMGMGWMMCVVRVFR